jgi:RimJ/RimL family protein N-acetyltransferase
VGLKKKVYEEGYRVEYSILIGESVHYSKGLGTKITRHFVTEAFLDPEVTAVNLAVREDNLRAIKCYEKARFQVTGFFFENDVKMLEMRIDKR